MDACLNEIKILKKRITRDFYKKKLLGDISISDSEYDLLLVYLANRYIDIANSKCHVVIDPVLCVALVQVGMRCYDGDYWGHIRNIIADFLKQSITPCRQRWIGESFVSTMRHYEKIWKKDCGKSEYVNSILLHGFVSDKYMNDLFDFLFAYYRIDIHRNLKLNTSDNIKILIEAMLRKDNTGRSYLLRKQTADAVRLNTHSSRKKIQSIIKLIDNAFWGNQFSLNDTNRLQTRFNEWKNTSSKFHDEYSKYHNEMRKGGGKKYFSSPYLKCNFYDYSFSLVLPSQMIRFSDSDDEQIMWVIKISKTIKECPVVLEEGVIGNKTEEYEVSLTDSELFSEISIDLLNNQGKLRNFKINDDVVRFFDADGDFISTDLLKGGDVFSFSNQNIELKTTALIDRKNIRNLLYSQYCFNDGDVLQIPGRMPMSIGGELREGLLDIPIPKVYAISEDSRIPLYPKMPMVYLVIKEEELAGTRIALNGNKYRLKEIQDINEYELLNSSGKKGYSFSLEEFGDSINGIYELIVDVPNARQMKKWTFALLSNFKFCFEESPYIFRSKGVLRIPVDGNLTLTSSDGIPVKNNLYNFDIEPNVHSLELFVDSLKLSFEIPMFLYKLSNSTDWQNKELMDIWYRDFPQKISVKFPSEKITIGISDSDNKEEYHKLISKELFECDLTRFQSWLKDEDEKKEVYFSCGDGLKHSFLTVATKSIVKSCIICGDLDEKQLVIHAEIIGGEAYYLDIRHDNNLIAEKVPLIDGRFQLDNGLPGGIYHVDIFEQQKNETGFGGNCMRLIGTYNSKVVNRYNLKSKKLYVKNLRTKKCLSGLPLFGSYVISLVEKIDDNNYLGVMKFEYPKEAGINNLERYVNVSYDNLDFLNNIVISVWEENGEHEVLLYDEQYKLICIDPPTKEYQRYRSLWLNQYYFSISM